MSLDKGIMYGKEHRKEYYGSQRFDKQCRCNGGCIWCQNNRNYKYRKKILSMNQKFIEFVNMEDE